MKRHREQPEFLLFPKQPDYQRSTLPDSLPLIQ